MLLRGNLPGQHPPRRGAAPPSAPSRNSRATRPAATHAMTGNRLFLGIQDHLPVVSGDVREGTLIRLWLVSQGHPPSPDCSSGPVVAA